MSVNFTNEEAKGLENILEWYMKTHRKSWEEGIFSEEEKLIRDILKKVRSFI